jgi:glycerol-3-phosphate dehydrogenase (NAD(P)+)
LDVTLWAYERDVVAGINLDGINPVFMPGVRLPKTVKATSDLRAAVEGAGCVLLVVPSPFARAVVREASAWFAADAVIVSAVKGIEKGTLKTASAIIREFTGARVAVLSGPSFAAEVIAKKPTAVTLAVQDKVSGAAMQDIFNTDYFRVYTHDDIIGAEIGGALKNVIAVASGITDGLELGADARAALITRGLAEITRLGVALGANERTFSGLSGLGDLVLTCTGTLSRNYTVGFRLGQGERLHDILKDTREVAEGVETSASAFELAGKTGVEMPIVEQVYHVIHGGKPPREAVSQLMTRRVRDEF